MNFSLNFDHSKWEAKFKKIYMFFIIMHSECVIRPSFDPGQQWISVRVGEPAETQ